MSDAAKHISCSCYGHTLYLDKDEDCVYVSSFRRGYSGGLLSWTERLQWCWDIIRYGIPYVDEVVLGEIESKELKAWVNSNVK